MINVVMVMGGFEGVPEKNISRRALLRKGVGAFFGVSALGLAWQSRAPQVATFLVAAGLRRARVAGGIPHPEPPAEGWGSAPTVAPNAQVRPNLAAMVCYHPEYQAYNPNRVDKALRMAAELNAGWLRTDVRWSELMPDGKNVNRAALDWYRRFLPRCQEHGLRNMVVVSWPGDAVLKYDVSLRLDCWRRFVDVVVRELGQYCQGYQLMNEPNNPVFGFFPSVETSQAIAQAASTIKSGYPAAYVCINICMEIWGWRGYLTDLLSRSGRAIDVIGLDHYPGTWTIGPTERWADVFAIYDLIQSAAPDSIWFGRSLGILETGFSTNAWLRGENAQAEYFADLKQVVKRFRPATDAPLVGIYELSDWDSTAPLDPEAHFGLLRTDLEPKAAFWKAQELLASLW
jgi:hypothetical protein